MSSEENNAERNALCWMDDLREKFAALDKANDAGDYTTADSLADELYELPLSIDVRCASWTSYNWTETLEPDEYQILLTWGGPAARITGDLADREPETARLEHQDWGTEWTALDTDDADAGILRRFAAMLLGS